MLRSPRAFGTLIGLLSSSPIMAQNAPRSPTVEDLQVLLATPDTATLEAFWLKRHAAGPLIEHHPEQADSFLVTVFYRGTKGEREVHLRSNAVRVLLPSNVEGRFQRIGASDVWYLTMSAPTELLTTYAIRIIDSTGATQTFPDPLNPDSAWTSSGTRVSVLALPGALADRSVSSPGSSRSWEADTLQTGVEDETREVWVRLPANYDRGRTEPYPVVIALNRFNFRYAIPSDAVIDGLAASGAIAPVVLIVTDELDPDSAAYSSSARWVADHLLPWIREHYRVSHRPSDVVLVGASRRGLVAAHVALLRPDAVGNVLSLSGAFYWRPSSNERFEWLAAEYARRPAAPVRVFLAVGTLETVVTETNAGHYPLATNRHFADILQARGYDYALREFVGTHDEVNWQRWLGRGLVHLLGDRN